MGNNKKKNKGSKSYSSGNSNTVWDISSLFTGWDSSDDAFPVIALVLLVVGIVGGSAYFIFQAPILLDTIFFEILLLAGTLKKTKSSEEMSLAKLIGKTWLPFFIVFILVIIFSLSANAYCPGVSTFDQLLSCK